MLPHVVVHNEMSLDARMDGLEVDMGRFYSLAGTWHEDCTLVGSETLLAGMPELGSAGEAVALEPAESGREATATGGNEDARPLLAAVDSRGRLPGLGQLRGQPYWRDVVALCSAATPPAHLETLAVDDVRRSSPATSAWTWRRRSSGWPPTSACARFVSTPAAISSGCCCVPAW